MAPASKDDIKAMAEGAVRAALDSSPPRRGADEPVTISPTTRFSWPIVTAVVALAATLAGSFARGQSLAQQADETTAQVKVHAVKLAEMEAERRAMRDLLERLERKVDRIEAKLDKK